MLKLTRKELDTLAASAVKLDELLTELETEREVFMSKVQELVGQIGEASQAAWEVMDDTARSAEEYYDDKSDKWQEGERGTAYGEWRDRLREVADAIAEGFEPLEVSEVDRPGWVDDLRDPDFSEFEFEG